MDNLNNMKKQKVQKEVYLRSYFYFYSSMTKKDQILCILYPSRLFIRLMCEAHILLYPDICGEQIASCELHKKTKHVIKLNKYFW